MIPILFDDSEKVFNSNGLGRLSECVSFTVTEERNGIYECEFEYPITGVHYSEIEEGRYVYCTHDDTGTRQAFEIYAKTKPINGIVTFYGHHISYKLNKSVVMPFRATSVAEALALLPSKIPGNTDFTFWTDKSTIGDFAVTEPKEARAVLGGSEGSILDIYGKGDYEWDMYTVKLHQDRGVDSNVEIRYGKNMADLTVESDSGSTFNAVVPFWKSSDESQTVVTLPEQAIVYDAATRRRAYLTEEMYIILRRQDNEPLEVMYPIYDMIPLDLSDQFEEQPTVEQLRAAATAWLNASEGWNPSENITVDFVQMWQTEEYKDYAPLQRVRLCDTVSVYYPELGVAAVKKKVVRTVYNVLTDRYDVIELGDLQYSFAEVITGQIMKEVPTNDMMQDAIQHATNMITGGLGGYVVIKPASSGYPEEILIMDQPDVDDAVNVIRMNKNGIGFSTTGYSGPYTTAWTIDGAFVADFITAGTLNANIIKAGVLSDVGGNTSFNLATGMLNIQKGTINLGNGKFTANNNGHIHAEYGDIGGFSIDANKLYTNKTIGGRSYYFELRSNITTIAEDFISASLGGTQFYSISPEDFYVSPMRTDGSSGEASIRAGGRNAEMTAAGGEIAVTNTAALMQDTSYRSRVECTSDGLTIITGRSDFGHSGNLYITGGGTAYFANEGSSSRKIKDHITEEIGDDLDPRRLYDVDVVQFRYKDEVLSDDDSTKDKDLIGFIVEDLDKIYPAAVQKDPDDPEESKHWSWSPIRIIPPMLKLIQEQKKQIDDLEARLAKVEEVLNVNSRTE